TDLGIAIAVDGAGSIYLTGESASTDFPITPGALDGTPSSLDVFVTKLDATGALVYSTFIGGSGSDNALAIALDVAGDAFVFGWTTSTDYPTTPGAFDRSPHGNNDAFVTKLNATGTALVYSTYLGGRSLEQNAGGIAVDAAGNAYVTGGTA